MQRPVAHDDTQTVTSLSLKFRGLTLYSGILPNLSIAQKVCRLVECNVKWKRPNGSLRSGGSRRRRIIMVIEIKNRDSYYICVVVIR